MKENKSSKKLFRIPEKVDIEMAKYNLQKKSKIKKAEICFNESDIIRTIDNLNMILVDILPR